MASRIETITHFTDDLDGGRAEGTLSFAFDGTSYEIDLSKKNRAAFEKALKPYLDSARRVRASRTGRGSTRGTGPRAVGSGRSDLGDIRAWAREQGQTVSDRGRIPQSIVDAYDAAH